MTPLAFARFLITLEGRVSRRAYALTGFVLMALKYVVEAWAVRRVTGETWTPLDYFLPAFSIKASKLALAPDWFMVALGVWTLPFVWIGAAMTLRRARDAGLGAWPVVLFFAPLANYLVMLGLSLRGPSVEPEAEPALPGAAASSALESALMAVGFTAAGAVALASFSTVVAASYGNVLFLGLPFVMGFEAAYFFNRRGDQGSRATLGVVSLTLGLTGMLLLLFALEGVVCLVLVLPVAWPISLFGGAFGRALALGRAQRKAILAPALLLSPLAWAEARLAPPREFEVLSAIEIDASRERVWPNVIGFSELPPPEHWLFSTGIAYPLRAVIEGEGVGAVRRCEFSTGAFVEPITRWEPPSLLAFDVQEHPQPMEEWSFYRRVHPPHLERSFRSLRGEFRLVALPGERTLLEGRTWYALELAPTGYWRLVADAIVHRIHTRVLAHVRVLSEVSARDR